MNRLPFRPSFPNFIWERLLLLAKFHFAPIRTRRRQAVIGSLQNHALTSAATGGFTLLEMIITLVVFLILAASVFGLMTGVLESTGTLQDNQNRHDKVVALSAFITKKFTELPANSTIVSYQRGDGAGLVQNGVLFGTANLAQALDATTQSNGYYQIRLVTLATTAAPDQPQDARQTLLTAVTSDDPTLVWTPLMGDIKTLDWKFLDFNQTVWVDLWNSGAKPNLVEFSMLPAGDLQATTMDFWLPAIAAVNSGANRGGGGQ